ncbi:TPA: hypothetical protein SJC78_001229 [Staphylococcus aureus]|nr:hypothetical protein [Staphylococcus aureus]HEI5243730.1 hypothetical protein [Staphylococcus aureus]HEI5347956.1 hypothetical protein [Staphylococcus aureus]HEI5513060.1 hypothetical protein [Staphylococcus aureus]HEI5595219.1 hypothetical protein [Staphylococcus aureus]
MEFIQSTLFSNVVAFLALGLSAYSIFYTRSQNKFSFVISDLNFYYENNFVELNFVVANDSSRTHTLEELIFLDKNKNVLTPINVVLESDEYSSLGIYNPSYLYAPIDKQLDKPEVMIANSSSEFLYKFELEPAFIKIVSNQRINKLKKYKLISTDSYEHN